MPKIPALFIHIHHDRRFLKGFWPFCFGDLDDFGGLDDFDDFERFDGFEDFIGFSTVSTVSVWSKFAFPLKLRLGLIKHLEPRPIKSSRPAFSKAS